MFYFLDKNFWTSPALVLLFIATLFVIVMLRYLAFAELYQLIIKRIFGLKSTLSTPVQKSRKLKEIKWSALSSLLFALLAAALYGAYQNGWTKIYAHIDDRPVWYFPLSIAVALFFYETYYYWLHRWMHQPRIFKHVHKVHHESNHPTVFTSFSFHPLEAMLQFIPVPLITFLLPIHYVALLIVLLIMTVSAIINHAGKEIFPKNFHQHFLGRCLIGSTHHDLHHKEFKSNFGLYFTFWDQCMKTESRNYNTEFQKNTRH